MMKPMEIENNSDVRLVMAKGIHEGDDKYSWFEHKNHMIQQILSHISKIVATSNFKILTLHSS